MFYDGHYNITEPNTLYDSRGVSYILGDSGEGYRHVSPSEIKQILSMKEGE